MQQVGLLELSFLHEGCTILAQPTYYKQIVGAPVLQSEDLRKALKRHGWECNYFQAFSWTRLDV